MSENYNIYKNNQNNQDDTNYNDDDEKNTKKDHKKNNKYTNKYNINIFDIINNNSTIILSITIPLGIYIGMRLLILEFGSEKKSKSPFFKYMMKGLIDGIKEENQQLVKQFSSNIIDTIKKLKENNL